MRNANEGQPNRAWRRPESKQRPTTTARVPAMQRFQRSRGGTQLQWQCQSPFNVDGRRWSDWPPRVNGPPQISPRSRAPGGSLPRLPL